MELSTGLVRQQRKASSHKSPCMKHITWLHSQGNVMGYNMASQYMTKSARFLCNCNALERNFQYIWRNFQYIWKGTMNWICLCAGMQAPTNPISCILACRSLSAVLIVTEVMVKFNWQEMSHQRHKAGYCTLSSIVRVVFHCISWEHHPSLPPKYALSTSYYRMGWKCEAFLLSYIYPTRDCVKFKPKIPHCL